MFLIIGLFGKIFSFYRENSNEKGYVLLYIASALGVVLSGDFLTLYVFWEAMAITSTFVIWSTRNQLSLNSGNRYIILHLIGGLILLIGLIGLYGQTYDLTIREISLNTWYSWFILIGLLLNAGAPPFSQWIPDAYPEGSYSSSVFLSAYTTKTSVYVLIVTFAGNTILIYIGIYMILYGIVYALLENDIRRILSYSIVNQVGFMIVGIGIGTELAINGTSAHAFSHIIYKGLLLMSAGSVLYVTGKRKCTDVGGLYKTMPITAACGIIGAFAISAFPFTSGFISKSMIVVADESKKVDVLGKFNLPVEVSPEKFQSVIEEISTICPGNVILRRKMTDSGDEDRIYVTDNDGYILDCEFGPTITDPAEMERMISVIDGVVEVGLFVGICDAVFVASHSGVDIMFNPEGRLH